MDTVGTWTQSILCPVCPFVSVCVQLIVNRHRYNILKSIMRIHHIWDPNTCGHTGRSGRIMISHQHCHTNAGGHSGRGGRIMIYMIFVTNVGGHSGRGGHIHICHTNVGGHSGRILRRQVSVIQIHVGTLGAVGTS